MSPDRRQRLSFVILVLCLVALFLVVVHAPLVAWAIFAASVGFCVVMITTQNPPRGSGRR
jgi:hypothetical protein